jgi:dTMP kinase
MFRAQRRKWLSIRAARPAARGEVEPTLRLWVYFLGGNPGEWEPKGAERNGRRNGHRLREGAAVSERGTYVVVEGIDGTGKTELCTRLVPPLLGRGHSISSFHEPSDRFLREQAARLAMTDSLASALCHTVDRSLQRPEVERALESGDVVIQDKSFYATLAYQYPALKEEAWRELERIEQALAIDPDLVLYLDAPVEMAMKRAESRGELDPFEDEPYLNKVRRKFEQMFQPPKWVRIDATGAADRTVALAMNALMAAGL